jgi:Restriction endonuclease/GYF domain 2
MARRRASPLPAGLIVVAGILWVCTKGLEILGGLPSEFWTVVILIVLGIGLILVLKSVIRNILDAQAGRSAARKAGAVINEQLPSLVRRRAQLVRPDAYGKPKLESWAKEISYFVDQHIKPQLTPREYLAFVNEQQSDIIAVINMRVEVEVQKNPVFTTFSDDMTPSEFETFCAEALRRAGWDARVTLQSRDQGVDVVAEKKNVRVVLQCKLYKRPVGNKAVQEAAAARAHERADFGIVVSNSKYTQDAEQLASTNSVLLLHYSDLQNLDALIRPTSPVAAVPETWYYDDGKGQVGPLTLEHLTGTLTTLVTPKEVFVWCNRLPEWKLVKDVPQLNAALKERLPRIRGRT